jgi:hypothetical protein
MRFIIEKENAEYPFVIRAAENAQIGPHEYRIRKRTVPEMS